MSETKPRMALRLLSVNLQKQKKKMLMLATAKERFEAYCAKIAEDLVSLHEAYEGNINSHGRICAPIADGAPSLSVLGLGESLSKDVIDASSSEVDSPLRPIYFGIRF
jgi:hypothetical protein